MKNKIWKHINELIIFYDLVFNKVNIFKSEFESKI